MGPEKKDKTRKAPDERSPKSDDEQGLDGLQTEFESHFGQGMDSPDGKAP